MGFRPKILLVAASFAAIGVPLVFGPAAAQRDAVAADANEVRAEQAAQFGPKIRYDVSSVRVAPAGNAGSRGRRYLPDGVIARGMSLYGLFQTAYDNVPEMLIVGQPDWWRAEKYDVVAKTDSTVAERLQKLTGPQRLLARDWMLQELLADRFRLKVHWETRQLPRYVMTVAKDGPKFKEAPAREDDASNTGGRIPYKDDIYIGGPGKAEFEGVTMNHAAYFFLELGRPVADETGLTGHYDFIFRWAPSAQEIEAMEGGAVAGAAPNNTNRQPAFAASDPYGYGPMSPKSIEKQLGLHLEPGTGPVRVLVIDHVEKPSEN